MYDVRKMPAGEVRCRRDLHQFLYDAMLRRHAVQDSGGLRYFTWDSNGMNLLCERDASDTVTAYYTHGYTPINGIGSLVAAKQEEAGASYYQYPVYDHRGSVVRLVDENGTPTAYYEYDAWGNELRDDVVGGTGTNRFRYQSNWIELTDSDGELYLSPTRLYHVPTGRFLEREVAVVPGGNYVKTAPGMGFPGSVMRCGRSGETMALGQGMSSQSYCGLDPVGYLDVLGSDRKKASKPNDEDLLYGLIFPYHWRVSPGENLTAIWKMLRTQHGYKSSLHEFIRSVKQRNPNIKDVNKLRPGEVIRFSDPSQSAPPKPKGSPGSGMINLWPCNTKFSIRTVQGIGFTAPTGAWRLQFDIKDRTTGFILPYLYEGPMIGASLVPIYDVTIISTWVDFDTPFPIGLDQFEGGVILQSISLLAGDRTSVKWMSGTAAGIQAAGWGWGAGIDVGYAWGFGYLEINDFKGRLQ